MLSWFVDEFGVAWRDGDHRTAQQFGHGRSGLAVAGVLVRNDGYVRARQHGKFVVVEFNHVRVEADALIGLLHLLTQAQPDRVAIVLDDRTQPATIFRARNAWLDYLGTLITARKSADIRVSRAVPLHLSPFYSRYEAGLEVVRSVPDARVRDTILEKLFQGKFAVSRIDCARQDACVVGVGSQICAEDPVRMAGIVGRSVDDIYDTSYGSWVKQKYFSVVQDGGPSADDVDATVRIGGTHLRLLRYSRLTAPISMPMGEQWVLSVSQRR